jgi:hypothetical protein
LFRCVDGIILRACSAVEVFDFFHYAPLAMHPYRHHCLAALRRDKTIPPAARDALD